MLKSGSAMDNSPVDPPRTEEPAPACAPDRREALGRRRHRTAYSGQGPRVKWWPYIRISPTYATSTYRAVPPATDSVHRPLLRRFLAAFLAARRAAVLSSSSPGTGLDGAASPSGDSDAASFARSRTKRA